MTASKLFCTTLPPQFLTGIALFSCIGLRIHVPPKANWFKAQSVYLRVEYVLSFTTVLCKLCFWIRFYREFTNSISPNNDLNVVKHQLPMFTFIRWCVQVYSQPWFCQEYVTKCLCEAAGDMTYGSCSLLSPQTPPGPPGTMSNWCWLLHDPVDLKSLWQRDYWSLTAGTLSGPRLTRHCLFNWHLKYCKPQQRWLHGLAKSLVAKTFSSHTHTSTFQQQHTSNLKSKKKQKEKKEKKKTRELVQTGAGVFMSSTDRGRN